MLCLLKNGNDTGGCYMARKNIEVDYANSQITLTLKDNTGEPQTVFSFLLERFKDVDTYEETLKISCQKDGKDNGVIVTDIMNLSKDITGFMRFGVVIGQTYFSDVAQKIQDNYFNITEQTSSLQSDNRLTELLSQVKEYVGDSKDYRTQDFCFVPVVDFNGLAEDCGYASYEMKPLRALLVNQNFVYTVGGRFAQLKRIKTKPERVVMFYKVKLETVVVGDGDEK